MMFNLIMGKPPVTVEIDNMEYPINWDFRIGMTLDGILKSGKTNEEKMAEMLQLYYPVIPANIPAAVDRAIWFYNCGDISQNQEEKQRYRRRPKGPAYLFEQDAPYVHAAFLQQYDKDLSQIESMHWWEFMALFESLNEETKMSKIMYYRLTSTTGMSKDQRAFINEMKKLYKIKDTISGKKTLSLAERNHKWREYVKERQKLIKEGKARQGEGPDAL